MGREWSLCAVSDPAWDQGWVIFADRLTYRTSNPRLVLVVNTVTNRVVRLLGKDEVVRWLNLSLYQGAPSKKGVTTMVRQLIDSMTHPIPKVSS